MSNRRLPIFVAHADWSLNPNKRWLATANLVGEAYHLSAPEYVGDDITSLLYQLNQRAGGGPIVVGFDFPIGLPSSFAIGMQITHFMDILPLFGNNIWSCFYEIASNPEEISFTRPFYPYRPGGTSHAHLTSALGVPDIHQLLRTCERRSAKRGEACVLFWTLGAKQVGRGAIVGWRDMLAPALKNKSYDIAVWPFDGPLDKLLQNRQCIVVETYPAEACLHLGMTPPGRGWSKRRQSDRRNQGHYLIDWSACRGVLLEQDLENQIRTGFGPKAAGEDPFDAIIGLMSMIEVLLGYRPDGAPPSVPILNVEGWIFGQVLDNEKISLT